MKRFSFHLESLLRMRSHKEEEWRRKLGVASTRCNSIMQTIERLNAEEHTAAVHQGGTDIEYYQARELYLGRIRHKIKEQEQELEEAELERKKVLTHYTKARQEYRAVQILKDKRLREYRRAWFKEEDKEIDDIVNARVAGGFSE